MTLKKFSILFLLVFQGSECFAGKTTTAAVNRVIQPPFNFRHLEEKKLNAVISGLETIPEGKLKAVSTAAQLIVQNNIYEENIIEIIRILSNHKDTDRLKTIGLDFKRAYTPYLEDGHFWNYQAVTLLRTLLKIKPEVVRYLIDKSIVLRNTFKLSSENFYELISDLSKSNLDQLDSSVELLIKYKLFNPELVQHQYPLSVVGKIVQHLSYLPEAQTEVIATQTAHILKYCTTETQIKDVLKAFTLLTQWERTQTQKLLNDVAIALERLEIEPHQIGTCLSKLLRNKPPKINHFLNRIEIISSKIEDQINLQVMNRLKKMEFLGKIYSLLSNLDPDYLDILSEFLDETKSLTGNSDEKIELLRLISKLPIEKLNYIASTVKYWNQRTIRAQATSDSRDRTFFLFLYQLVQAQESQIPIDFLANIPLFFSHDRITDPVKSEIYYQLLRLDKERIWLTSKILSNFIKIDFNAKNIPQILFSLSKVPRHLLGRLLNVTRSDLNEDQVFQISEAIAGLGSESSFELFISRVETLTNNAMRPVEFVNLIHQSVESAIDQPKFEAQSLVVGKLMKTLGEIHFFEIQPSVSASILSLVGKYGLAVNDAVFADLYNKIVNLRDKLQNQIPSHQAKVRELNNALAMLDRLTYLAAVPTWAKIREHFSQTTYKQVLSLVWLAIHDPLDIHRARMNSAKTEEAEIQDREMMLWMKLSEAYQKYWNDDTASFSGIFNKIVSTLDHMSPFIITPLREDRVAELFKIEMPRLVDEFIKAKKLSPIEMKTFQSIFSGGAVPGAFNLQEYSKFITFLRDSTHYKVENLPNSNIIWQVVSSYPVFFALVNNYSLGKDEPIL